MNNYRCIKQYLYHEDIGEYVSYGIDVKHEDVISDVSCDIEAVLHIVGLLNQYGVSRIHVKNVVEDLLAENE